MKLIDIEQEVCVPIYDDAQEISYEETMTVAEMFHLFARGYEPPTVEAIPITWIREKMKRPLMTTANPFDYVLFTWQAEQNGVATKED